MMKLQEQLSTLRAELSDDARVLLETLLRCTRDFVEENREGLSDGAHEEHENEAISDKLFVIESTSADRVRLELGEGLEAQGFWHGDVLPDSPTAKLERASVCLSELLREAFSQMCEADDSSGLFVERDQNLLSSIESLEEAKAQLGELLETGGEGEPYEWLEVCALRFPCEIRKKLALERVLEEL